MKLVILSSPVSLLRFSLKLITASVRPCKEQSVTSKFGNIMRKHRVIKLATIRKLPPVSSFTSSVEPSFCADAAKIKQSEETIRIFRARSIC